MDDMTGLGGDVWQDYLRKKAERQRQPQEVDRTLEQEAERQRQQDAERRVKDEARQAEQAELERRVKFAGWHRVSRDLFKDPVWSLPPNTILVLFHLLSECRFTDEKPEDGGRVLKGEVAASRQRIAFECRLGRHTVRSAINQLVEHGVIATRTCRKWTVFSFLRHDPNAAEANFFVIANTMLRRTRYEGTISPPAFKLLVWLIGMARYGQVPRKSRNNGDIHRGEVLTSYRSMASACFLKQTTIHRAIKELVVRGTIRVRSSTRCGTIIGLVNYEAYQTPANYDTTCLIQSPKQREAAKRRRRDMISGGTPEGLT